MSIATLAAELIKTQCGKRDTKCIMDFLEEEISEHSDDFYKSDLQQANIASNIIYFGQKIAECVEHINFGGLQPFKLERSDNNAE